jgi:NADH:ubiquinone oxidoreductase subunit K
MLSIPPPGLGVILTLAMVVFVAGLFTMLLRRHALIALAGSCLMLQAALLLLASLSTRLAPPENALPGSMTRMQVLALVVVAGMVAQVGIGLAVAWSARRHSGSAKLDDRILEEVERGG